MRRKIAPEMSDDNVSSALVLCVSSGATTSETRLSLPTKQGQAPVTVTEPEDLSRSIVASASTPDSNIKVVELSSRPLQAQARLKTQRLNKKKAIVLADCNVKAEARQKKNNSGWKNRCCRWCKISCNSDKVCYDYNQSRKHRRAIPNLTTDLHCSIRERGFAQPQI